MIERLYNLFLKSRKVSTDTRKITPGCIFFALKGDNFNGNQFANEALNNGAAAVVIDQPVLDRGDNVFLVENALKCLQQLANHHRSQLSCTVIGITGSNGKTTTKELMASVLAQKYKVQYTQGNLNNHIGVPLTLLLLREETEMAVIEMGANHKGEIGPLSRICEPNFGLITNIGKAHLEGFGSFQGIIEGKSELYHYINKSSGKVFCRAENPHLTRVLKGLNIETIWYGDTDAAEFKGELLAGDQGVRLKVGSIEIQSHLQGDYNFENILAAACIGSYFDISIDEIKKGVECYQPDNHRSQLMNTDRNMLYVDAYNANPSSMAEAVTNFAKKHDKNGVYILGDMKEMGAYAEEEHQRIIDLLIEVQAEHVLLVGHDFKKTADQKTSFKTFENVQDVIETEAANLNGQAILLKGSRSIQLDLLIPHL